MSIPWQLSILLWLLSLRPSEGSWGLNFFMFVQLKDYIRYVVPIISEVIKFLASGVKET